MAKNANRPAITVPTREGMSAVRCSFVHLGRPYAKNPQDTPKYTMTCLFNKQDAQDMAAVQQLAADLEAVRVEQWPNPQTRPMVPIVAQQPGQGPKSPIKDGDVASDSNGRPICEKNPEYAGHYVVACSSTSPVSVLGPNMEMMDGNMCKSGYWYKVSLNAYTYDNNGGGSTVGLNGAQFMREDLVLGGAGPSADQMFSATGGQNPNMYGQAPQQGFQPPAPAPGQPAPGFQQPQAQGFQPPAPGFQPPAPGFQAPGQPAPGFQPPAPGQSAPGFQQPAPGQPAPGQQAQGFQQPAPGFQQPAPQQQGFPGGAEQYVQQPAQQTYQAPAIQQPGQPQQYAPQPLAQPGSIV